MRSPHAVVGARYPGDGGSALPTPLPAQRRGTDPFAKDTFAIWAQDRFVGPEPASLGHGDDLTQVIALSKAQPRMTSYCLTVKADGK